MKKPCKPFPPALPWGDGSGEVPGGDLGAKKRRSSGLALGGVRGGRPGCDKGGLSVTSTGAFTNFSMLGGRRISRIYYTADDPHLAAELQ